MGWFLPKKMDLQPKGVEVGILGGQKINKSGKCHELSRKLTHPTLGGVSGGVGVDIAKVREISRTAEKIYKKTFTLPPRGVGVGILGVKKSSPGNVMNCREK